MNRPFYPPLPANIGQALVTLERLAPQPGYLEQSPYPQDFVAWFLEHTKPAALTAPPPAPAPRLASLGAPVEDQIEQLYQELVEFGSTLTSEDTAEKMSYLRTRTQLLEKLILLRERTASVKKNVEFQHAILEIMARYLTPDQISEMQAAVDALDEKEVSESSDI